MKKEAPSEILESDDRYSIDPSAMEGCRLAVARAIEKLAKKEEK